MVSGQLRGTVVMTTLVLASTLVVAQTTLSDHSRRVLDAVRKKNSPVAKLMLAADPSQASSVAAALRALGGEIRFEDDRVGYVRVIVPIAKVDTVTQVSGVQAVEPYYLEGPEELVRNNKMREDIEKSTNEGLEAALKVKLPADVPLPPAPYATQAVMGTGRLLKMNPTFDGRGVVIAIVDGTPLLTHPELRWARALDGRRVPKILDVVPTSLPQDGNDPWWVDMRAKAEAREGVVLFEGKPYRVPHKGTFRIGIFTDSLAGKLAAKVHPPGTAPDPHFAVLWDPAGNTVWVDTNQNRDFGDETALRDYRIDHQVGIIGSAEGALDQKVAFTVSTAPQWNAVHLALGEASHGTMCASTAAGNKDAGGLFDGVAPNAQIITYDGIGGTGYATEYIYTEALIRAVSDPRVNVVSASVLIADDVANIILARLSILYDKPIASASILDTLPPVFSVFMYMDRETMRRNLGITGERAEFVVGSRMPLRDGRLGPDVLGANDSLAAGSPFEPSRRINTQWLHLPMGYMIGGGASQATPMFAGLLADVISAALQTRTPVDLSRLIAAVRTGSRWISEVPGSNKSAPLPQADQVWNALRRLSQKPPARIDVAAPLNSFGWNSRIGLGVVDEHGAVGVKHSYRTSLTRRSGPPGPVTYDLHWLGNDGTFRAPRSVTLDQGQATIVETYATPRSVGVTTAVLELIDRTTQAVAQQVPHSLIVPVEIPAGPSQWTTEKVMIEQHGDRELEIRSPAQDTRMEVEIASADPALDCFIRSPDGHWLVMMQTVPFGVISGEAQLGQRSHWEKLADVSPLGLAAGYGFRAILVPDASGLWHITLTRRGQPDIELPHTHTPEDMKPIPVIVRAREVAQK